MALSGGTCAMPVNRERIHPSCNFCVPII